MKTATLLIALLVAALPALAEDADLAAQPGYVDFGALAADYGEPRVMIDLGGSLLKLVSAMKHDDPMAAKALSNLESVRVNVYNTAGDTTPAKSRMAEVNKSLKAQEWEQIVRVREPEDQVDIYVKYGENVIHGVTVMAVDVEEAVFINVLGNIDPAELGSVMDHVDIDLDVAIADTL